METLQRIVDSGTKLTPMMEQYLEIKKQTPDTLLLFRMGDFYEVFFEDAIKASKVLNITLTHRGKLGEHPIPMAGIPHHAANAYVDRLTSEGLRVAICEQVEDPKEAVGIVRRAVTQIVSPGLPYDLDRNPSGEGRFILAGVEERGKFYFCALDFSTGRFKGHILQSESEIVDLVKSISPKEIITFMGQWEKYPEFIAILKHYETLPNNLREEYFDISQTAFHIEKIIPNYKRDKILMANAPMLKPIGALAYYVGSTQQIEDFCHISSFSLTTDKEQMRVTAHTLKGLEILPRDRESYNESLLGFFDRCKTAMGPRILREMYLAPLININHINLRLDWVESLSKESVLLGQLREILANVRDIDRILAKVTTKKITAGDLLNLAGSIEATEQCTTLLRGKIKKDLFNTLPQLRKSEYGVLENLAVSIRKAINDEIGASIEKGNLIQSGYSKERDRLFKLAMNANDELLTLEEKYRQKTNIQKLKIKNNNVNGFFIEITKTHSDKVPSSFQRKQTLVNSERYITDELVEFEKEIISAKDKLERTEKKIFNDLVEQVSNMAKPLQETGYFLGTLDIYQSFAWMAIQENLVRPTFDEDQKKLSLKGAFHPLIRAKIKDQFVPHNLNLDCKNYFGLITGPNMAGKTTVMREAAIIQFLAQIGSFVPALQAELGICDQIFSRLGASDDIQRGQSTFMVEMSETAEILRHATEKSLIILDEVGRGTSTYDGLSIAWGLVEHFVNRTKALTLFATHYHELIDVVEKLPGAKNLTVKTFTRDGEVHFLYQLIEEGATQSFGLYVAKLAGLPKNILKRSEKILHDLEKKEGHVSGKSTQLSFFDNVVAPAIPEYLSKIEGELARIDLMSTTPIDALCKLKDFQDRILN